MELSELEQLPPWEWPEGAGRIICEVLLDPRESDERKLLAAEMAGVLVAMDDALAEGLLSLLTDDSVADHVRGQAAISLGPTLEIGDTDGFDDPEDVPVSLDTFERIQDTLRTLYRDPDVPRDVRRRILEAAVRAPRDWHKDAVRAAFYSGDEDWRLTAVFAMRYVASFDDQIMEALDDPNRAIRYEALHAAGAWEIEAAWPHVRTLLQSTSTPLDLLIGAIHAAGGIGGEEGIELLRPYADSGDEEIADAAGEALLFAEAEDHWPDLDWPDEEDEGDESDDPFVDEEVDRDP